MIRIGQVKLTNFLTIKDVTVDFANRGLIAVLGPNGSGKSSLMVESLIYGLFGITERFGNERDRIVNRFIGENCHIHLPLTIDDMEVVIDSYRKHKRFKDEVHLTVNGKDSRGRTNNHTWDKIEKLLDMDVIGFQNSIVFGQSMSQYAGLADAQQKAIVERLLGCSWIPKAYELAGAEKAELDTELATIADRYDVLEGRIKQLTLDITEYQGNQATFEEDRAKRIHEVLEGIQALKITKVFDTEIKGLQNKLATDEALISGKAKLDAQIREIELDIRKLEVDLSHKTTEIKNISNKINKLGNTKIPEDVSCDECGQSITMQSTSQFIEHLYTEVAFKKAEADTISEKRGVKTDEFEPLLDEQKTLTTLEKAVKTNKIVLDTKKSQLAVIERENARLEERNDQIRKRVEEIKKEKNIYQELIEKLERELVPLALEKQELVNLYGIKKAETYYNDFMVEFYSNRGYKSYLIESVLPAMNEFAAIYSRVLGGKYDITFSPQKQLKGGELREKFNVEVMNRAGSEIYEGNSSGEKRAIDAIVLFTLGDLAASRLNKKVSLLILDDVFERLDRTICEAIIRVLKIMVIPKGLRDEEFASLPERESIIVLTHLEYLESQFENKIHVERGRNGQTEITE